MSNQDIRNLRFHRDDMQPLSDAEIKRFAPAVFTTGARADMSSRYQFVPTFEIVNLMREHGLMPVQVQAYYRHDPKRVPYAMHMLRFSLAEGKKLLQVDDVQPQIVLRNAHDGSCQLELYSGLFRLVCSNGMIVSDSDFVAPIIVRHTPKPVQAAFQGVVHMLEHQKEVFKHVNAMRSLKLSDTRQRLFATKAMELRPMLRGAVQPAALLEVKRPQDKGDDLWHVFNRVQDHLSKGGLEGKTANGGRTKTKGVQAITADLTLNAGLWSLAMGELKKAA